MPSYAQLESEPYWRREIVTDELDWLGDELCRRAGRPRDAFGSKGNNSHLSGGHRSQEWIKNSDWCTNTSYTAQTGLSGDQLRHIAACDFTPGTWGTAANRALMMAQTKRLWDAARRGELTGLRQIFGTLDGRNAIGLNVLSGSTTVPDSSHLDHWHLTFDRKAMRDMALMRRIADIALTGDDMTPVEHNWLYSMAQITYALAARWDEVDIVNADTGVHSKLDLKPYWARMADAPVPVHLSDGDRIAISDLVSEDVLAKVLPLLDVNVIAAKVADLLATRLAQ